MTKDKEAERIAAGLTEAQRRALLAMPEELKFNPRGYARSLPTIAVLQSKRLIRPIGDPDFEGPWSDNIMSHLGRRVRAFLIGDAQ